MNISHYRNSFQSLNTVPAKLFEFVGQRTFITLSGVQTILEMYCSMYHPFTPCLNKLRGAHEPSSDPDLLSAQIYLSLSVHMGQFLQGGKNGRLMSFFFFKKVEPLCDQT